MQNLAPHFLTLIVVIFFARFMGLLFRRIGQPPVMGEVLGGILLGPSCLAYFYPDVTGYLFHSDSLVFLKHVAEIGICLYLFVMGLEIDLPRLQKSARSAFLISQLSIIVPFVLGIFLAKFIFDEFAPESYSLLGFALFIGVSLSVTAFPVLARILSDSPLHKTKLGDLALTCAAIDDITAWCLVAVVTGLASSSLNGAGITIFLTLVYILVMLFLFRPLFAKYIPKAEQKFERLPEALLAFSILGALISSTITESIGIHGLFGAFFFGAVIPHDSLIAHDTSQRLQDFLRILFLPAFFALTGMKTEFGLISGGENWLICGLIIILAVVGKFSGAYIGGILSGNTKRESMILGILMNTRGLVELIVLNIGLSLGILTPKLFTMLVIMALVTTFMAGPLLKLLKVQHISEAHPDRAED